MINELLTELRCLGDIGQTAAGGSNRVAYTEPFYKGRDYVQKIMQQLGLDTRVDRIGNLFGTTKSGTGPKILLGSHLDTVPNGGIYDGALGVLAGIECVRRLNAERYRLQHPIQIVGFVEEEGNAVGGTFGSRCMCGQEIGEKEKIDMARVHLTMDDVAGSMCDPDDFLCYLEMHIEQGGILESEGACIGAVEGIVAIIRFYATVNGQSNHAGSTPMWLRKDAMLNSCNIIRRLMQLVMEYDTSMVCTVGEFSIPNGAVNVIPGKTEFLIEMRYKNIDGMISVIQQLREEFPEPILQLRQFLNQDATKMDARLVAAVEDICKKSGVLCKRMYSGAGHDAINTARIMPAGLFFIPSRDGISHSPQEYSSPDSIEQGINVLVELVKSIDSGRVL